MNKIKLAVHTTELNGQKIEYRIRRSQTGRKCRIRINSTGVEVVLPQATALKRAETFLRENAAWVLEQIAEVQRHGSIRIQKPTPANSVLLRGVETPICITEEDTLRRYGLVVHRAGTIRIRMPKASTSDPIRALTRWLHRQAREDIECRLSARGPQMRVRPNRVYLMSQRTKWGNCSRLRNLSFNWRLIMAPPEVLDYIVVHELAHLREPSHSTRFWLLVRSYCAECEQHKRWLRDHQNEMYRFG